jgi:hypothetical protein
MMTDEDTPNSKPINNENSSDVADKKGQMLVIYLPEGSVIVDRSDVNLSSAQNTISQQIAPKPVQQLQPTLQEVVQLAVAEVLQITGLASNSIQKEPSPAVRASEEIVDRSPAYADSSAPSTKEPDRNIEYAPTTARRVHVRRRRHPNWIQGVNTLFVVYLFIVSIVPSFLSSAYGVVIYASKVSHPGVMISQGDMMVARQLPASSLRVNDVLLVRNQNSWHLGIRAVTAITATGSRFTITTTSTGGIAIHNTSVLASDAGSYKVSQVIPKLGYIPIVLSSTLVKVLGALSFLILNLTVYFRRTRRRRLETVIR